MAQSFTTMPSARGRSSLFYAKLDDAQERAFFLRYTDKEVEKILTVAGATGARAAARVVKPRAPVGSSSPEGQYYRAHNLGHETFRRSVGARKVRKTSRRGGIQGLNARTIAYVVGPVGKNAFTRWWVEGGTRAHIERKRKIHHPGSPARPWFAATVPAAVAAAKAASDAVLVKYANVVPGKV